MYPHHVFDLEPAGTFGMYPICYQRVSGRYFQPEPAMYSRCFCWFPGPLTPSGCLVETIVGSLPVQNPHLEQQQERRIIDFWPVHHSEPFSPADHMRPQPIIKEEVWEDVIPPVMVCSCYILPLLDNPMEGILGNLESLPQCFFNQKWRGKLPHESSGNVPNQMIGCVPFCWNTESHPRANLWSAGWLNDSHALQRPEAWWWDVACWPWRV